MLDLLRRLVVNMRIRQLDRELAHWDDMIAKEIARHESHDALIAMWRTECRLIEARISALRFRRRLTYASAPGKFIAAVKPYHGEKR